MVTIKKTLAFILLMLFYTAALMAQRNLNAIKTPYNQHTDTPPIISYITPQVYHTNQQINDLIPTQSGGAVTPGTFSSVITFAGNGIAGKVNGTGSAASFSSPLGLAVDSKGYVYVAERDNSLIRRISPSEQVITLAGSGITAFADGNGTAASFNRPFDAAVDNAGNVYVADLNNNRIRKVTLQGEVITIAGNAGAGATDGIGTAASFHQPTGIAIDKLGSLYIADLGNNLIRKITPNGLVVRLAGSGAAGKKNGPAAVASFNGPIGIAVDLAGNVFVADSYNNIIRKITPAGDVSTFAGNGTAGHTDGTGTAASFHDPIGLTIDADGNLYVTDAQNNLIRKITPAGLVTTAAGNGMVGHANGSPASASFNTPFGITIDNAGNLYVGDTNNNLIRKIIPSGYTIVPKLPQGLIFDVKTGIISGIPAVTSPAINYTVTAYNAGGSKSTIVNIKIDDANTSTITFAPIANKTVCDNIDFDPGAISTSGNAIIYTSSNPSVADITGGKIHITGAGVTTITATDGASPDKSQTLTVTAALTPTVTITPVSAEDCIDASVSFAATYKNGGDSPVYQWLVNGQNSGQTGPVFTSTNLNDNDQVTCVLTSNAVCTTSATAVSNTAVFVLDPPVQTLVTISSSANGPICPGTEVIFTAAASRPDLSPVYQWLVNGINTGTNSAVFSSSTLVNGDVVTCTLTSTGKCIINPIVTSSPLTVSVSPVSLCTIVIPNTFTPNGDGINDLWDISALISYPNSSVTVYTRYGSMVYKSTGYTKAWDGTLWGKALPVGTYYYMIDLKNGKKALSGALIILR